MKFLLIGWDGVAWSLLRRLLAEEKLPNLRRLAAAGSCVEFRPFRPAEPVAVWTSLVTGKRPHRHGVVSSLESSAGGDIIRHVRRSPPHARPVWSILSEAGVRSHAINWPASHPAEAINGVAVSDYFLSGRPTSVWPADQFKKLREFCLRPEEVDPASVTALLPKPSESESRSGGLVDGVAHFIAAISSWHAVATQLIEHEPWDFAAVRYRDYAPMVDRYRGFPSLATFQENACRFYDMMLRRLLDLAGAHASVALVCGEDSAILSGPALPRGCRLRGDVWDVAPTVLSLFGVPAGRDMDGQARWIDSPGHVEPIGSWDRAVGSETPDEDDASITHLLAVGYRETPDAEARFAALLLRREREFRLAEACAAAGAHQRAAEILEPLVAAEPSVQNRSALAEAYFHAGRRGECRRLVESLRADSVDTALLHIALAALAASDGHHAATAQHLVDAENRARTADEWHLISRIALRVRQWNDARRAMLKAIELNADFAEAHDGLALLCLISGDPAEAEGHARRAVAIDPSDAAVQHLALAQTRQGRHRQALGTLTDADLHRRGLPAVHRLLAEIHDALGDATVARFHRQRAMEQSLLNVSRSAAAGRTARTAAASSPPSARQT